MHDKWCHLCWFARYSERFLRDMHTLNLFPPQGKKPFKVEKQYIYFTHSTSDMTTSMTGVTRNMT